MINRCTLSINKVSYTGFWDGTVPCTSVRTFRATLVQQLVDTNLAQKCIVIGAMINIPYLSNESIIIAAFAR